MAIPVNSSVYPVLHQAGPTGYGVNIWLSNVTDTIFGEDTTDFDFHIIGDTGAAVESIETFAAVFPTSDADATLVAFLNATMSGTMTTDQAADKSWLCNELSGNMASMTEACEGITIVDSSAATTDLDARDMGSSDLFAKRANRLGRFGWIGGALHVGSKFAVEILQRSLENNIYQSFSKSPRSWCNAVNGVAACVSWSKVETWNHYYAQEMVADALSVIDFDRYSAQANGVLSSRKRSAADVCISNRADGCT